MLFYLLVTALTEISSRVLGSYQINNLPLLHFYTIIEFLFILRFFQLALNIASVTRFAWWLMFIFPVFSILNFIFIQNIHEYNSYPRSVAALTIIGFCLFYFFNYQGAEDQKKWIYEPCNWIVTGTLIYFGSSLFYFAFSNLLNESASLSVYFIFAYINATLVMVMYLLFTIGFLYAKNE